MKKFATIFFIVILIFVWLFCIAGMFGLLDTIFPNGDGGTDSSGGNGGSGGIGGSGGLGGEVHDDGSHTHQFESYFFYSECTHEDCAVVGRNGSEKKYASEFVYTLTGAKIDEISALYGEILTYLDDGDDYKYFEKLYEKYEDWYEYAIHQYQVSSILSDVEYNTTTANDYRTATKLYNEMRANYYGLYGLVYESAYRDEFYEGWSDEEIDRALQYAEIYSGSADNNNAVDDILAEYEAYMDSIGDYVGTNNLDYLGNLYGRLVEANNNVAKASYYNNYMDYAYSEKYHRDYTPSQVSESMRKYVKTYIAPLFIALAYKDSEYYSANFQSDADKNFYYALMSDSLFADTSDKNFDRVKSTLELVSNYLGFVNRPSNITGGEEVNFRREVEDLFKNGNYFTGDYRGAYTWWISKIQKPILYFGPRYNSAFTFVHEFGHYYNNIYNGSMSLSYDHDETHSQGNEMLFLAWLAQNKPEDVSDGFSRVEVEQLYDMLINIVIATAVDEFEQAAYTGYYNGEPINCSYADLFVRILGSYKGTYKGKEHSALLFLNNKYWAYVVFKSAGYYISYAMSALPSIEIYAIARGKGLQDACTSYVNLFTFSNSSRFVDVATNGKKTLRSDATYEAILNYCGLQGPFQKELYTTLKSYFDSRTDLK